MSNYSLNSRTLRIRQSDSLGFSIVKSISPLGAIIILPESEG